jgi:hypothetical protein
MSKKDGAFAFGLLVCAALLPGLARADNWTMSITVDNQYDVYFGTPLVTTYHAGGDNNWPTVETWNATGMAPTDYLYVATASDQMIAQGFLGVFTNTTLGTTVLTGDPVWQVFPAGAYLQTIDPSWPAVWPPSVQPTQSQVDQAITFATNNGLWQATSLLPGWTNAANPGPWGHNLPNIPGNAFWIWHDKGNYPGGGYPAPYGGWNHDEFLVFRVPGIGPEPASGLLWALGGLMLLRRGR